MAMGTTKDGDNGQERLWISHHELANGAGASFLQASE